MSILLQEETALQQLTDAIEQNHDNLDEIVELLLRPENQDRNNLIRALIAAVERGQTATVTMLITAGADIDYSHNFLKYHIDIPFLI